MRWTSSILPNEVSLGNVDVCVFPLTQHVAREPGEDSPLKSPKGEWSLYEDRPNKPGWITTTVPGFGVLLGVNW